MLSADTPAPMHQPTQYALLLLTYIVDAARNNVAGRSFNVVPLSHEGRSKRNRHAKILGLAASGKVLIRADIPLIETLHQQQRSIALDKKRDRDDYADACNYAID